MKVLKFGSAAIATADRVRAVAAIIEKEKNNIVVLSSIRGTAEILAEISKYFYNKNQEGAFELINELDSKAEAFISELFSSDEYRLKALKFIRWRLDYIRSFSKDLFTLFEERIVMSQGELMSTDIFSFYFSERGTKAITIPALDFMRTDKNSVPDQEYIKEQLNPLLNVSDDVDIFLTQGYICRNAYGEIDDLRKGGSDYTASLIGSTLKLDEIQIWADVDVMQNNDSRYIKGTTAIRKLNFDEAAELTYFGDKILHPSSILPAKIANVPVRLKNTTNPDAEGTLISNDTDSGVIKAVAAKEGITVVQVKSAKMLLAHGFLRRILEVFESYQTPIDMITTSEVGVSITIDDDRRLQNILDDLKKYGTVSVDGNMTIVCVIGDLNWQNVGFEAKIMDALKDIPVRMISYGGSNYNMSFLVKKENKEKALNLLNDKLFGKVQ
jgi:aspartate kinase